MITTFVRRVSTNKLYGRIIKESRKLILLHAEEDFLFNGFIVIRNCDVIRRYQSDANAYCMELMKREGLWKTRVPKWVMELDVSCWKTAISGIRSKVIILENESQDKCFYIGPVLKVRRNDVAIRWFDGLGVLGNMEVVRYSGITSCRFQDRYSLIHSKYIKSAQQVDAAEASTIAVRPSKPSGSPR